MKLIAAVALALAFGCATTTSPGASAARDNSCTPAVAALGTTVYSRPDSTSTPVADLQGRTQVCASANSVGFGYRHVKLSDGREGYILEDSLM